MSSSDCTELPAVVVWIIISLCVVAFVLNIVVIIVITRKGSIRSSIDILLINLAVCDILLSSLVHPLHFKNVFLADGHFTGGNATCKLVMFVPKFIIMSAVFTILAVAADRYRVMMSRKRLGRRGALIVVCMIWLAAVCYSAPQFYEYNIYEIADEPAANETLTACGSDGIVDHFETVYASVLLVTYFISFLLLNIWYGRISYYVWQHARRFQSAQAQSENPTEGAVEYAISGGRLEEMISKRKIRVLKMLISVTAAFVLLWTPYFVLFAIKEIWDMDHTTDFGKWPHVVTRTMTVLSTVVNPALFLVFSVPVKEAVVGCFSCRHGTADACETVHKISAEILNSLNASPSIIARRTSVTT